MTEGSMCHGRTTTGEKEGIVLEPRTEQPDSSAFLCRIAERIRAENLREAKELERRRVHALAEARSLALECVRADPSITKILLFGSLLPGRQFRMDSDLDLAALGYTIHSIYGIIENYCFRVAKFFENGLDPYSWHKYLLRRMTLDINEVRPALFGRDTERLLDELRAFRHVFRNLYARDFDYDRIVFVQRKVGPSVASFRDAHRSFVRKLEAIKVLI